MNCEKKMMRGKLGSKREDQKKNEEICVKSSSVICAVQGYCQGTETLENYVNGTRATCEGYNTYINGTRAICEGRNTYVNGTRAICEECNTYVLLVENGNKEEKLRSSVMKWRIILQLQFQETICSRKQIEQLSFLDFKVKITKTPNCQRESKANLWRVRCMFLPPQLP